MSTTSATMEFTFTEEYVKNYPFILGNIEGSMSHIQRLFGCEILTKSVENKNNPNSTEMSWEPPTISIANADVYVPSFKYSTSDDNTKKGYSVITLIDIYVSNETEKFYFPKGTTVFLRLFEKKDELSENAVGTVTFNIEDIAKFYPPN